MMSKYPTLLLSALLLISMVCSLSAQTESKFILVDQFGYLPDATKIAVIRDPVIGFDADESFTPGANYAVVDASGAVVFTGNPVPWNNGATDDSSGDKAWHFDFSSVSQNGTYYILDVDQNLRSYRFEIGAAVYNEVLKHAVRTFFYQRAGFAKNTPFADAAWADGASHLGPLQDTQARLYSDPDNAATERDLSGGWYDAGDYNKYTNWTANYAVDMIKAYRENPSAWGDDYKLPESGNGLADLLDEAKWGLDFLLRMQEPSGAVLSIVDLSHASPPSSAPGISLYGPATTSATQNTASAFAIAATVFRELGVVDYAEELVNSAEKAWQWSANNPTVVFYNNRGDLGTAGIGAGQQEEDEYNRAMGRLEAACYLFEATGKPEYRTYFDNHYQDTHLFQWNFAYPFETNIQEVLLYYTQIPNATTAVASAILSTYGSAMNSEHNFAAFNSNRDPFLAYLKDYTWGSNGVKARKGSMFYNLNSYAVSENMQASASTAAATYLHYLHGVNPLNLVYLSNMANYGAENSVNEFYHEWFQNGHAKWDRVGVSEFGPAPGFVTGGPNPSYDRDGCCPNNCGSSANNSICDSENLSPPNGQPNQKSYKDFNTSWPLNSWSVTENSNGYQMAYIRLLSKFVDTAYDCNNDLNGTAFFNACGTCVGGNTGIENDPNCQTTGVTDQDTYPEVRIFPNPVGEQLNLEGLSIQPHQLKIFDLAGKWHKTIQLAAGEKSLSIASLPQAIYLLKISGGEKHTTRRFVKL